MSARTFLWFSSWGTSCMLYYEICSENLKSCTELKCKVLQCFRLQHIIKACMYVYCVLNKMFTFLSVWFVKGTVIKWTVITMEIIKIKGKITIIISNKAPEKVVLYIKTIKKVQSKHTLLLAEHKKFPDHATIGQGSRELMPLVRRTYG